MDTFLSAQFFQQINYSAATEDGSAEIVALRLEPGDRVLCVTGSGARSLDLLTVAPAAIHSVDFSAPQNHLLELKMAAYRHLTYADFRALMGLEITPRTVECADAILPHLPADARVYWQKQKRTLRRGALYCGTWEKLLRWMSATTFLRLRHVRGLLEAPDLAAQRDYWQKHWTGSFFRNYLRLLANRFLWVYVIREPGAKLIARNFDVARYLMNCIEKMVNHSLLRENPYANLLFYGRYTQRCQLPLHLQEEHFETIRSRLDRIHVHTLSLCDYLGSSDQHFDAYSLSDFSSYASVPQYESTWQALIASARSGARYCERFFLVPRTPITAGLNRDPDLEARLFDLDHTCLYTFHAGTVA